MSDQALKFVIARARDFYKSATLDPCSEESFEGLTSEFAEALVRLADTPDATRDAVSRVLRDTESLAPSTATCRALRSALRVALEAGGARC